MIRHVTFGYLIHDELLLNLYSNNVHLQFGKIKQREMGIVMVN